MAHTVLRIDASARRTDSVSRALAEEITSRMTPTQVIHRDLAFGIPQIDETWVGATFTLPEDRTDEQKGALALSDSLVAELQAADTIVIGTPIYNFGVPAALKAWIDQIARVGVTFQYTAEGPKGLLEGKRAIIAIASGGTEIGSDIDFATGYLQHVLGFVGITEVEVVAAGQLMVDADAALEEANAQLAALAA